MSYNRYSMFKQNGKVGIVPFGKIPKEDTDLYETYIKGKTRLDILSYEYYKDSNYAWLILQANPQYGSLEFDIPDKSILRIPYPLKQAIERYEKSIKDYNDLY